MHHVESSYDVLDATIIAVSDRCSTNGDPPVLSIHVHQVLYGSQTTGKHQAIWSPLPHDVDTGGNSDPRLVEWRARPLAGPVAGTRMIVLGAGDNQEFLQLVQIPSTDANLRLATEAIEWGEQLRREVGEYWDTFPENVNDTNIELVERSRTVTEETRLEVGQPVLVRDEWFAGVGRSRVIDLLDDGQVKVRPSQYNSRWDRIVARDEILLYPDDLKSHEEQMKAWRKQVSVGDLWDSTAAASFIGKGTVVSGSFTGLDADDYVFEIHDILKGEKRIE
jgi:hypothetical protein